MSIFLTPDGEYKTVPDGRVTTFGLNEKQNRLVESALPSKGMNCLTPMYQPI